jgi:outer membrane protein
MKTGIICSLLAICCHLPAFAAVDGDDCASRKRAPEGELTLQQVVELGLCRNPTTAAGYLAAEAARFGKNAGYANYLPNVSASASIGKDYRNRNWGEATLGGSISASWLIFDFGKRLADLNALAAVWRATGLDYDESSQNYVYGLIGSYYGLLTADADVKSGESLRAAARTAKDTADKKFKAGSVAKADVYKAETNLASRELDLERAKNNREIAKGKLLSSLSFAADDDIKIADMPSEFGSKSENKTIEELLETASKQRPDLLRATANKDAAWHRRNSSFLKNLPSISATGSAGYNDYYDNFPGTSGDKVTGSIGLRASMPIFAGFANIYGLRAAEANYDAAKERERAAADNAKLDVFSAFQNYKTAQKVLEQTGTLLKSASENERVVAGMYKVGRGTMLDWQTAQSELASAQKQNNAAKYDLFVKRAALALSIGDIKSGLENESPQQEGVESEKN